MRKPTAILADLKKKKTGEAESRYRVRIGMATCGISAGADAVYQAFQEAVKEAGLDNVDVIPTGCVGRCDLEPLAEVLRGNETPVLYSKLDADKTKRIVKEHLAQGKIVKEYAE